jgi:HD domain
MSSKLRRQIAWNAAMLMYHREESEYYQAKMKAARRVVKGWVKPADLPSNSEIRDQIQALARTLEGADRDKNLQAMRVAALRMMILCENFFPRLIGSVLTGHVRHGSDIDIHLFANNVDAVTGLLEYHGLRHDVEKKVISKSDLARIYRHVHVKDDFDFELTVYPLANRLIIPKSSITGKAIERMTLPEFKQFMAATYAELDLDEAVLASSEAINRFEEYRGLLLPLENVKQNLHFHPEGDALYHSLQVFDLACNVVPYDEEFLLAALLHDVGKAIDNENHVAAGLEALGGLITERTQWLIEHHMLAHRLHDRTIGARARKRLESSEYFDDLLKLNECDRLGRKCGIETTDLDDALDYVRGLDQW